MTEAAAGRYAADLDPTDGSYVPTYVSSDASTFVSATPTGYITEKGTYPGSTTGPAHFLYAHVGTGFQTDSTFAESIPPRVNPDTKQVYP